MTADSDLFIYISQQWLRERNSNISSNNEGDPDIIYWEVAQSIINDKTNSDLAWNLIMAMIKTANTDIDLSHIGTGPLEDFVTANGKEVSKIVINEAKTNSQLTKAIEYVWFDDDDSVWTDIKYQVLGC